MKRIILTWLALCAALFGAWPLSALDIPHFKSAHIERLLVTPAHAQFNGCQAGFCNPPAASGGGGGFSLTYKAGDISSTSGSATVDYGTLTWGSGCTAVVITIAGQSQTTGQVSSVSVAGNSPAEVSGAGSGANESASSDIYQFTPVGTSGDVQVTYSASVWNGSQVGVYCLVTTHSIGTGAWTNNSASSVSATPTVPSGGGALAVVANGSGTGTFTWTNATADEGNASSIGSTAHTTSTGSVAITATANGGSSALFLSTAYWSP